MPSIQTKLPPSQQLVAELQRRGREGATTTELIKKLKIRPKQMGPLFAVLTRTQPGIYHVNASGRYVYGKKRGRTAAIKASGSAGTTRRSTTNRRG
jgi:hypothetical protein